MSESQIEQRLKAHLSEGRQPARTLIDRLQHEDQVSASSAKMALLRLANRSEVRVASDLSVELVEAH
jgi:hypothetical protein